MRALAERVAGLFDPEAPADGPPPRGFLPFLRWALRGSWGVFWAAMAASALLAAAEVGTAWLIGWAVDLVGAVGAGLADPAARAAFLAEHGWALAGAGAFVALSRPLFMMALSGLMTLSLQPGTFQLTVFRLHRHTLGQSLKFFEEDFAGRLASKEVQTGNAVTEIVSETVQAVAFAAATLAAAIGVLWSADGRLAAALVVWLAVYFGWVAWMLPRLRESARLRAEAQAGLSGRLVDTPSQMATVKLFAHAGREEAHAGAALERLRAAKLAFGRIVWVYRAVVAVLGGLLPLTLVGLALWLWQAGTAGPGTVAVAGLLATRIAQMSGWISFTAMGIFANVGVVEDGVRTLARPHGMPDSPGARDIGRVRGELAFAGVTFRYGREGGARIGGRGRGGGLDGFSLRVAPGEKVALVGRSGAGKSTVMRLALRLDDPEVGRVTLDGTDLRELTQDSLRRQIALVTQDTAMFNRSALDNILYGAPEAGREAAVAAARKARADDFIRELTDPAGRRGYDAHLGERGVKLSGGQRQRVAIARAILKDAPVLMLDEATSALDSETEAEVQAALEAAMEGRTVIAIAHRLSTIARMDRIAVMEAGRIVEEGTHAGLLERGGAYAALWERQSGGFLGDGEARAAE